MKPIEELKNKIIQGDCMEVMREMPDNSIDTVITDPPYFLGFMGKKWDTPDKKQQGMYEFNFNWAKEALRVAKPGATLLCFGGTRTWHRLACAIEDAGWIIKDTIMWIYGSGFPKSLNISKQLDKKAGKKGEKYIREDFIKRSNKLPQRKSQVICGQKGIYNKPATPEAKQWEGYGTALKPAYEPILLCIKPNEGSYAENALKWGVAGLNIDGGRIGIDKVKAHHAPKGTFAGGEERKSDTNYYNNQGRFPANLILDEESAEMLDSQSGILKSGAVKRFTNYGAHQPINFGGGMLKKTNGSQGGASRFFYVAKASRSERNAGCEGAYILKENTPEKIKKEIEKYLTTIKTDDILKE